MTKQNKKTVEIHGSSIRSIEKQNKEWEEFDKMFKPSKEWEKSLKVYDPNSEGICALCGFNPEQAKRIVKNYIKQNFIHKAELKEMLEEIELSDGVHQTVCKLSEEQIKQMINKYDNNTKED